MSYNYPNAVSTYRSLVNMFRSGAEDFNVALTAFFIASEMGGQEPGELVMDKTENNELMLELGRRIMDVCYNVDDARFTHQDMADAIVHFPAEFSLKKLVALNDDDFATVILYMAQCKRDTYESDNEDDVDAAERILQTIMLEKAPPAGK